MSDTAAGADHPHAAALAHPAGSMEIPDELSPLVPEERRYRGRRRRRGGSDRRLPRPRTGRRHRTRGAVDTQCTPDQLGAVRRQHPSCHRHRQRGSRRVRAPDRVDWQDGFDSSNGSRDVRAGAGPLDQREPAHR